MLTMAHTQPRGPAETGSAIQAPRCNGDSLGHCSTRISFHKLGCGDQRYQRKQELDKNRSETGGLGEIVWDLGTWTLRPQKLLPRPGGVAVGAGLKECRHAHAIPLDVYNDTG